ncbi:hypothetical protein GLOIN_2v1779851 [Rhizophagus irregularis DAOM 181602=DAOM 197198]|nr:hypothetical protein GLOIN_2v1779851 [Rhizophagus irregularis DAOM 181602=DAOM 197198]
MHWVYDAMSDWIEVGFSSSPFPPFVLLSLPSLFPSLPFPLSFRHLSPSKIQNAHLKGSGGLPKYGKTKFHSAVRVGFRSMEKPSFVQPFGWASVFRRTGKFQRFDRVGFRRTENQETKIHKIGGLPKNENPKIRSGGLPKNENPKIKIRSGGLLCGKTKIRSGGVGFRPSGKEEPRFVRAGFCVEKPKPRFDRVEWASDLREKKNQDLFGRAFVWKNQDSIGWNGLSTFGKRRTKIRKSRVSRVSSEERKKPKIRKFG